MIVKLRRLGEIGDKSLLFEWANSKIVAPFMYRDHEITAEEHEWWYLRARDDENKFIVQLDDKAIGFAQCSCESKKDRRWTWGHYIADESVRGRGVGKTIEFLMTNHIFNQGAHKICIEMFSWNERIIKLHHDFGYRREGYYQEHIWKNGRWNDVIAMAMTKDEWAKIKDARTRDNGYMTSAKIFESCITP